MLGFVVEKVMEKKRIEWVDMARGIGILLVIYGHSMRDEMRIVSPLLDYTYRFVYSFHMSFFFWLSGCTYRLGRKEFFIIKKMKNLLLPWVLYSALIYLAFSIVMQIGVIASVLKNAGYEEMPLIPYIMYAVQARNPWAMHLWFIWVLFIISVFIFLIDKIARGINFRIYASLLACCFIGVFVTRIFNFGTWEQLLNALFLYIPFYLLGILSEENIGIDKKIVKYIGGGGILFVFLRAWFWSGFAGDSVETGTVWGDLLVRYITMILLPNTFLLMREGCIILVNTTNKLLKKISSLGKSSFMFYLFHQPFCCAFVGNVLWNKLAFSIPQVVAVCIVLSILVPYLLMQCIKQVKECFILKFRLDKIV